MGRIGLKSLASFCKQTAVSIRSGLTLTRALPIITQESKDRNLRRTFQKVGEEISTGLTLADSLRRQERSFPPIFVEMVAAGEQSGRLEDVFARLAVYFDTRLRLRRGVIKASIYPMIQLTVLYGVVCLLLIVFSSDKRGMGLTIASYSITAAVALFAAWYFFSRTVIGCAIRDRIALALPIVRPLTVKLCMARFTRTLAMQMESGISIVEALQSAALVTGNGAVASSLQRVIAPIERGENLATAIKKSPFMTPMIREVLTVGEETGNFSESLERVATIYEEEALAVLESFPKFIGPVVVIIVGLAVLYLFYAVYIVRVIKPALDAAGMW
jgi:type IV pilus assembly protein PilC